MMRNKNIGLRLGVAFAILIALLLAIGQFGLRRMQQIDESVGNITRKQLTDLTLAQRALTLSNDNNRIVMQIVLVEDRALVEKLSATRAENSKEITRLLEESEGRCASEQERHLLSEVKKTRKPYVESYLRAIHLRVDEEKSKEAEALMVNEALPALTKYHAAWSEFLEFQKDEVDVALRQAHVDYAKTRRLTALLVGLAVAVALAIALFVTYETSSDVKRGVQQNEQRMRMAMEAAKIGFWDWDVIRGKQVWSDTCKTLLGLPPDNAADFEVLMNSVHPDDREMMKDQIDAAIQEKRDFGLEFRVVWPDGSVHWQAVRGRAFYDQTGRTRRMAGIAMDIDERKRAEESLYLQAATLEIAANAIVITDSRGTIKSVNNAFTTLTGYSKEEVLGKNPRVLKSGKQPESFYAELWSTITSGKVWQGEIVNRRKDGTTYTEEMTITPVTQGVGKTTFTRFVAIKQDITQRKAAEIQVELLAYYDALTGLPNRTLLQDRLAKALAVARRRKEKLALLFLDLDGFKNINDSFGHSVGDLVLQEVAERLKKWGREQDTVARVGGDEFIIVLNGVKDIPDAAVATERLMDAMTAVFNVQGHFLNIGCSIGISIFPEDGADGETLIKNADAAMYSSKSNGRNKSTFFTGEMNAQVVERVALESGLRLALHKKQLSLVYQPQVDIATERIIGLEALLRWQHPDLGLVPPDKFIRIAENSGLILPIGEWVLRTACSQARKWQDEGLPAVTVAVNVSAVQFRQEGFCELIKRVLHETGLAARYLELELTESVLLDNAEVILSVVRKLKAMELKLAIDDFGTGYSSLSYLRQFPVSKLKIDRSFVQDVAVNPDDAAITTAIIGMAKSLHLKVIAEGVENEAQLSFLRTHQCDEIQGYYFSRPLAPADAADRMRGEAVHASYLIDGA
jgi:diguanylate cyclase (GGDEF)-like protein/PAS domain S-box-containing protein